MGRLLEEQTSVEKKDLVSCIEQKKAGELDLDWSEIVESFDLSMNAETLRKAGVGVKLVSDAGMLGEPAALDMSDGYIERQKVRDLTRQVNEAFRSESRGELLRETIAEAIKNLSPIEPPCYAPRANPNASPTKKSLALAIGDIHYGAEINCTGLYGEVLNHYDSSVFESRMEKLLDETIDILEKENIDTVEVLLVGDLIDGILRQSQLMRLEYGIVDSTIRLAEYLSHWLKALSNVAFVRVSSVSGNHSEIRPLRSKNREFEDENLERIILWYLKLRLASNYNVEVDDDCRRINMVEIQGFSFLLIHGDGDRSIEQMCRDSVNLYGKPVDFVVCGHKHREESIPSGVTSSGETVIIRTPSICGMDKYAQSKGYGGRPGAIATVIEKGYGRRCVYPIKL